MNFEVEKIYSQQNAQILTEEIVLVECVNLQQEQTIFMYAEVFTVARKTTMKFFCFKTFIPCTMLSQMIMSICTSIVTYVFIVLMLSKIFNVKVMANLPSIVI